MHEPILILHFRYTIYDIYRHRYTKHTHTHMWVGWGVEIMALQTCLYTRAGVDHFNAYAGLTQSQ
jgi:hypothetical protein